MTTCKPSMQVPTSYKLFLNRVSSEVALLSFYTNAATDTNMNSPVPSVGIMCCLDAVYTKLERKNRCWGHRETFNCLSNKLHLHPHDWVSPLSTFLWHKIKKKKKKSLNYYCPFHNSWWRASRASIKFYFINWVMKILPHIEPFQRHPSKKNPGSEQTFSEQLSTRFSVQQLKRRAENETVRGASAPTCKSIQEIQVSLTRKYHFAQHPNYATTNPVMHWINPQ